MSLAWPGIRNMGGDLAEKDEDAIEALLNEFGDAVEYYLGQRRLPDGPARSEGGIAEIFAQHQKALSIGFDPAIVARERHQELDGAIGGLRHRGREPGGLLIQSIPRMQ